MFDALRKMIFPIIIIVLFFFVAMIVLQWGLGMSSQQASLDVNLAALINGEEVSWQQYNLVLDNMTRIEYDKNDGDIPESQMQQIRLQAWNQLLHDRLILQEVAKHNMIVTDEELYAYLRLTPPPELQALPDFQTAGKFDYQKYINAMANPQAAPFWASVEAAVKGDILKLKLQELIIRTAHVTDAEVKEFFMIDNEKVTVGMINVGYARFSKPPPRPTEEETELYFNERIEQYGIDERASLRIALVEKEPAPYDWEINYNRCKDIYDSIIAGADFAEMAKRYSDDGSAQSGGDLGWFPRGQMVLEFDRKVFNMKSGEVSEPVRTQFGWHIIKLMEIKEEMELPPGKTEKELVKTINASHILIKTEASQETLDKAYSRLEQFLLAARNDGYLKAAEDEKMTIRTTGLFFRGRNIQYIGNHPRAGLFAFNEKIDAISNIFENNSAYFVVQVQERLEGGQATFEEAKEKVNMDLVSDLVASSCRDTAAAIYAEIMDGISPEEAARKNGSEYVILDPFDRDAFVKVIRRDPAAVGAAFSIAEPGQFSKPTDYKQGTVIFHLIERITPDLTEFIAKKDSIQDAIQISKQQEMYGRWFENLVSNANIVNNVESAFAGQSDSL